MSDLVLRTDRDGLATLTLNQPDKLNALSGALFAALDAHLARIETELDTVGAVVLRGAGKCFCAGFDLAEAADPRSDLMVMSHTVARLGRLPQPVIAAIHGYCMTGGLELALAADILFAAESATFADTHGKWGLTPGWGMSQRLPRRVGHGQAARMMFTSARVPAGEALAIGLVDICVADERFEDELGALTAPILANSWYSHRFNKKLMLETDGLPLRAGLAHEVFNRGGPAPDSAARIAGFKPR